MNNITAIVLDDNASHLRLLDIQFAQWVVNNFATSLENNDKAILEKIAQAASYAVYLKHTCLDLRKLDKLEERLLANVLTGITVADVQRVFAQPIPPLVASNDGYCIWLQKYHYFEQHCAQSLQAMAVSSTSLNTEQLGIIDKLFAVADAGNASAVNSSLQQKAASINALQHQLAVITGGPGTGKTYTVARIIALLLQQNPDTRIVLAAPTGKAGQRMTQALSQAINVSAMDVSKDKGLADFVHLFARVPAKASTLHSLLGIGFASPKPRYHRLNPLMLDVLIIDEASMIDLPMMYRLLDALPTQAKLILLGDKDQLASVEAGSVLAELCLGKSLQHCLANITESRRFGDKPEIGHLAQWLNACKAFARPDIAANHYVLVHSLRQDKPWQPDWLPMAQAQYRALHNTLHVHADIRACLQQQTQFQVLCALRQGPCGVEGINSLIEKALGQAADKWYAGKPLMILQNDRERKLYNGDVGMVLPLNAQGTAIDINNTNNLKACFLVADGVKVVSRAQMPPYETCYAMTVHKSQGSEYRHVLIVLPADVEEVANNPVLNKELAYTAVTRAREQIDLYCGAGVLEAMAQQGTVRMSGLAAMLDEK